MKKKPIYLFCAACLAWSCSNDPTSEPDRASGSSPGEPVPIKLELQMTNYAAPTARISRNVRAAESGTRSGLADVEISAIEPAPGTRAGGGEVFVIPDDQKVFRLDILQFNGTQEAAELIKKVTYSQAEGNLAKYDFTQMQFLHSGTAKNRIVILGNADPALYEKLVEKTEATKGTTYGSLLLERTAHTPENDPTFPRVTRNGTVVPVFSGMTVTTVDTGSQIGVELLRNLAKVNFEFLLSPAMLTAYSHWDIMLHAIPPASFYTPQAYLPPFPEAQTNDPYYSKVLGAGVESPSEAGTPMMTTSLFLPVNLQNSVPGTVVSTRYLNAPASATALQLLGKKIVNGSVTQTVVYMIPLGANFTDDYSIRPNNAINYRITLASDSPDDSSVVKFIAGKFAGKFRKFTNSADGSECWGFPDELEVWPTDVEYVRYPSDSGEDFTGCGIQMPFLSSIIAGSDSMITTITDKMDGFSNTYNLCKKISPWDKITAAYMCLRQLNGLQEAPAAPGDMTANMWFLPAINQLAAIYVAGGSQVSSMQPLYWSSSVDNKNTSGSPVAVYTMGSNGEIASKATATGGTSAATYTKASVRGCRIPPPGVFEPKISR